MKVKSEIEVAHSCPTLGDPMNCSPLGSSVHGIFQAGVLEWGAIAFSGEDPLEKGKTTHSKYSGLENSMDCRVRGVAKRRD